MTKIKRGLRLAGSSLDVLLSQPVMLVVTIAGVVGNLVLSFGLFWMCYRRFPASQDLEFPRYFVALPVLWLGGLVTNYCRVLVTVMADDALHGRPVSAGDANRVAVARLDRIISWTILAMGVALVLHTIAERLRLAGRLASWVLGLAWDLATFFILPVIAFEDHGVRASVRRSASVFKSVWGETFVADGAIGVACFLFMLPVLFIAGLVAVVSVGVGIAVGVIGIVSILLVSGALDAVLDVALYRYATDGEVLDPFSDDDLRASFVPK